MTHAFATFPFARAGRARWPMVLLMVLACAAAQADDDAASYAAKAAEAAATAAGSATAAAGAAEKAGASSKNTSNIASKDANCDNHADSAATSTQMAKTASQATSAAAAAAMAHAKAAQDALARGDTAGAKAESDKAQAAAAQAAKEQAKAADAANAAATSEKAATSRLGLDQQLPEGPPAPTQAQQDKYTQQKKDAADAVDSAAHDREDATELLERAGDLLDAIEQYDANVDQKGAEVQPPATPLLIPFQATTFFDVFVQPDLHLLLPNAQAVPEISREHDELIQLFVLLFNPNAFDVVLNGIDGALFGDAVSFTAFDGPQTVPAAGQAWVAIGSLRFDGAERSFTAGEFSFLTDAEQPGLGPELMVNFSVVPEPGGLVLAALAACFATGAFRRRRRQAALAM